MLRNKIKQLFQDGFTQIEISKKLNCSKSIVSYHINDTKVDKTKKPCKNCGKITKNSKFCCLSCAASFNQSHKITNKCKLCSKPIQKRNTYCKSCYIQYIHSLDNLTIAENSYGKEQESCNKYTRIRDKAKTVWKNSNKPKICLICGYSLHCDICHIKPISKFDKSTKLKEVNSINNLVALCKNHHWEFDHGHISEEKLRKLKDLS